MKQESRDFSREKFKRFKDFLVTLEQDIAKSPVVKLEKVTDTHGRPFLSIRYKDNSTGWRMVAEIGYTSKDFGADYRTVKLIQPNRFKVICEDGLSMARHLVRHLKTYMGVSGSEAYVHSQTSLKTR